MEVNKVVLVGTIEETFKPVIRSKNGKLNGVVSCCRIAGKNKDLIHVCIDNQQNQKFKKGERVEIEGFVSIYPVYNEEDGCNHYYIFVNANKINRTTKTKDTNKISLSGNVTKECTVRITPKEKQIADVMLQVNIPNFGWDKVDYIPCIVWGKGAIAISKKVGAEVPRSIVFHGMIQSRDFIKKYDSGKAIKRTTSEFSVLRFELN